MTAMAIQSKHHWKDLDQSVFQQQKQDVVTALKF
jgi:hypothetical protein